MDGFTLSYFYHRGVGNGFSITITNSEMPKIWEGFVSEVYGVNIMNNKYDEYN